MRINKICLLINDDCYDQAIFVRALATVCPETLHFTAQDGIDALYMMLNENIVPDYIFVEMSMPRMDGISFIKEVKRINRLKDIPIVVHAVSAHDRKIAELNAAAAGAMAIYQRKYDYFGICNMLLLYFAKRVIPAHSN